jgi:nitroreductase/NAD-dependent dihydropyrimidine dehydrogenase PreA subunit
MSHQITISSCRQCYLCIEICPASVYGKSASGETIVIPGMEELCVACGHCMAVCETKSLQVGSLSYDQNFPDLPLHTVDYGNFKAFLMNRRSVRTFRDKAVPEELLQKIADAVSYAPYGVSPDNIEITVIANKELIRKALPDISAVYKQMRKMLKWSLMRRIFKWIVPKEDFNTLVELIGPHLQKGMYDISTGKDDISRDAPALILFHAPAGAGEHTVDSHIAMTYAFLAAHSLGLGATVIGLIGPAINNSKPLQKMFRIPKGNVVVETIIIGYPKIHFKRSIVRPRKVEVLKEEP